MRHYKNEATGNRTGGLARMRWLAFARCQRLAPANIAINDLVTSIVKPMRPTLAENIWINVELGEDVGHACGPGATRSATLETVTRHSVS